MCYSILHFEKFLRKIRIIEYRNNTKQEQKTAPPNKTINNESKVLKEGENRLS